MRRRRKATAVDSGSLILDYVAVASALVVDAAKAEVHVIGAAEEFERRTYARALFAFIEGVTYCQRRLAQDDARLSAPARVRAKAAAKHARHLGRKAGDKESLALGVRAAFAATAAAHHVANPLVKAADGWPSFRQAIGVRNRVTHPRSGQDCAVSDADVQLLRRVHHWYYEVSGALTKSLTPGSNVPLNIAADERPAQTERSQLIR